MEPFSAVAATIASVGKETAAAAETVESFLQEASIAQKGELLIQQLDTIKNTPLESLKAQVDGAKWNAGDLPKEIAHQQVVTPVGHETGQSPEILSRDLEKLGKEYNDELNKYSAAGRVEQTDVRDWEKVKEGSTELRTEFEKIKPQLRRQWEPINGREWPRYEKDVIDPNTGKTLRKAGDCLDCHHIQPLEFGGKNTAENITPIDCLDHHDHTGIHRPDGPYHELANHLKHV
jgi:hypothetical protein